MNHQATRKGRYAMRNVMLLIALVAAATGIASESNLQSAFYDPTVENAWTFAVTGNVNGGDPVTDEQAATNNAYGLISDDGGWVCKVRIVSAANRTLQFGAGDKDLYKVYPEAVDDRKLNLTGPITRENEFWTIVSIANGNNGSTFMQASETEDPIHLKEFWAPKTLTSGFLKPFAGSSRKFQNQMTTLVIDCPLIENSGLSNDKFGSHMEALTRVYLNLPKDTRGFVWLANPSPGKLKETDVSDWRLDSIPSLTSKFFSGAQFAGTGCLKLPSVTSIAADIFTDSTLTGLEIGMAKTNVSVSVAAAACTGALIEDLVLGGSGCTFSFGSGAFACASLKTVRLNGGVPVYPDGGIVFGTDETPALSIVFYPELCPEWTSIMQSSVVRILTPDERTDYAKTHPGAEIPYAVASPEVFRTKCEQYIAYPRFLSVDLFGDPIGLGSMRVFDASGKELDLSKRFYPDELMGALTLEATPETGDDAFVEWEGFDSRVAVTENPTTFVYGSAIVGDKIRPRFNRTWLYTPTETDESGHQLGTLTQGDWVIDCFVSDATTRKLTLGRSGVYGSLLAESNTGTGLLDLTGVVKAGNGEVWTIDQPGTALAYGDREDARNLSRITTLYFPRTLTALPNKQRWNWTRKGSGCEKIVVDCPLVMGTISGWSPFYDLSAQEMVVRLPNLTAVGTGGLLKYATLGSQTDFRLWNFDALQTSQDALIYGGAQSGGELSFPALTTLGMSALAGIGATRITFGMTNGVRSAGLRTIEANALTFSNDKLPMLTCAPNLSELVFNSKPAFTVGASAFDLVPSLTKITILGQPIDAVSLSNLVAAVATAPDKKCSLYVGQNVRGANGLTWASLVDPVLTAEEEPFRPASDEERTFLGVLDNPLRNCWVFGVKSPYDLKGFAIIFR